MVILDWNKMRCYLTLTTRLARDAHNYDDWFTVLNENIFKMSRKEDYLGNGNHEFHSLFDLVLDEVVIEMIRATIHQSVRYAVCYADSSYEALEWLHSFYTYDGEYLRYIYHRF
jgi:hypothetical protein